MSTVPLPDPEILAVRLRCLREAIRMQIGGAEYALLQDVIDALAGAQQAPLDPQSDQGHLTEHLPGEATHAPALRGKPPFTPAELHRCADRWRYSAGPAAAVLDLMADWLAEANQ